MRVIVRIADGQVPVRKPAVTREGSGMSNDRIGQAMMDVAKPERPEDGAPPTDQSAAAAAMLAGSGGRDVLKGQGGADAQTIDRPGAGEVTRIPTEAGGRYAIAFDPSAAHVEVAGDDFVLIFPDGGRVVLLDLVENSGDANPPILEINGMEVASNLLVAQALRLAEGEPTLETAAAPVPPDSGGTVYSDDFGDILGLLNPLGGIDGVAMQFGQIEPREGLDEQLLNPEGTGIEDGDIALLDDASQINPSGHITVDVLANDSGPTDVPLTIGAVDVVSGRGAAEIVGGRIVYHSAVEDENSVVELRYTLDDVETNAAASVFITIGDYENAHAFYAAGGAKFRNADGAAFETSISQQGPVAVEALDQPLQVDASLYPNESVTIQIQAAGVSVPQMLDLYLIQDLTGSFEDDLPIIRGTVGGDNSAGDLGLLGDLVAGVVARIPDSHFGVGTFRDAHHGRENFPDPHQFRPAIKLGDAGSPGGSRLDGDVGGQGYDSFVADGGGGLAESQIKALSLVAQDAALANTDDSSTTASELGFRLNAAKVALIITDSTSHPDVDRGVLRTELLAAGVIPIFLVADGEQQDEIGFYQDLVDDLGIGVVVPLDDGSTNLVEAITEGLTKVFPVELRIEGDENGYSRIVDTETVNGVTTWTVELSAPANDGTPHGNDDVTFRVVGEDGAQIGENVVVSVDTTVEIRGTGNFDTLIGHNGEDIIAGELGDDVVTGMAGADTFVFNLGADDGHDTVTDFSRSEDVLSFTDVADQGAPGLDVADVDAAIVEIVNGGAGGDVTVNFTSGSSVTLASAGIGAPGSAINSVAALVDDANAQVQVA